MAGGDRKSLKEWLESGVLRERLDIPKGHSVWLLGLHEVAGRPDRLVAHLHAGTNKAYGKQFFEPIPVRVLVTPEERKAHVKTPAFKVIPQARPAKRPLSAWMKDVQIKRTLGIRQDMTVKCTGVSQQGANWYARVSVPQAGIVDRWTLVPPDVKADCGEVAVVGRI